MTKRVTAAGGTPEAPAERPPETEPDTAPKSSSEPEPKPETEAAASRPTARPTGRRFRPRTVDLPEGETLTIDRDGTIRRHGADGATTQTWPPDDLGWDRVAIHFGLHASPRTVTPSGRQVRGNWPPR